MTKIHASPKRSRKATVAILAVQIAVIAVSAADLTWDITSGDGAAITDGSGTWTDLLANWNNGTDTTWKNANADSATFGAGGTAGLVTIGPGGVTAASLTFNTVGGEYTLTGNALTLSGAPTIAVNDDSATINAILSGNSATIFKTGTGILVLGNTANTFAGALSIKAGKVSVSSVNNDGSAGPLGQSSNAVTLGDTGSTATLRYTGNSNTSSKKFILTGGGGIFQIDTAGQILTLAGLINGDGGLTKTGPGQLTLNNNANAYLGGTTVLAGQVNLGGDTVLGTGNLTVDGSSATLSMNGRNITAGLVTVDNSGTISGGGGITSAIGFDVRSGMTSTAFKGTGGLTKSTPGTFTLNVQNTYTGLTLITAGTLKHTQGQALGSGDITLNGATAIWDLNGQGDTLAQVTLENGTIQGGNLTTTAAFYEFKNGAVSTQIQGAAGLNKTTNGTVVLTSTSNSFSGVLSVKAGTLSIPSINNSGNGGVLGGSTNPVVLGDAGGIPGTLEYTGATASSNKRFTMAAGGIGVFQVDNPATNLTLGGVNDGSGSLTKSGPGTLILSNNASTYTGSTTVSQGRLLVSGSISASSQVRVSAPGILGGSGTLGPIVANADGTDAGTISPGSSPGILTGPSVAGGTGLDFAFELTKNGSPTFGNATASGNDVLHLTSGAPFASGNLDASNTVSIYFDHPNATYRGGFYAFDSQASPASLLAAAVGGADFDYYIKDAGGTISFGGSIYTAIDSSVVTLTCVAEAGTFTSGSVNGADMQFVVIPEPTSAFLLLGSVGCVWGLPRRRWS